MDFGTARWLPVQIIIKLAGNVTCMRQWTDQLVQMPILSLYSGDDSALLSFKNPQDNPKKWFYEGEVVHNP